MSVNADTRLLQQVPLFANVDPAQLQVLVFSSKRRKVAAGSFVFKRGKSGSAAYFVLSGRAIVKPDSKSSSPVIARVRSGALLGEMAMIAKVPYNVSVQAVDDLVTLKITNDIFRRVCAEFPDFGANVMEVLGAKLDDSLEHFNHVRTYFENAKSFSNL